MQELFVLCILVVIIWLYAHTSLSIALLAIWSYRVLKSKVRLDKLIGQPMWRLGILLFTVLFTAGFSWALGSQNDPFNLILDNGTFIVIVISIASVSRLAFLVLNQKLSERLSKVECVLSCLQLMVALPYLSDCIR